MKSNMIKEYIVTDRLKPRLGGVIVSDQNNVYIIINSKLSFNSSQSTVFSDISQYLLDGEIAIEINDE